MPEKGEELYKILKADPNYEGVGSDYGKFKAFFSDEKNYTNLYNTLKADPNYEGIGKDVNAFSDYFGLKKKEQAIPFDGQQFGGKSEEPLLPLTSSTVSPSASKQPKSIIPSEFTVEKDRYGKDFEESKKNILSKSDVKIETLPIYEQSQKQLRDADIQINSFNMIGNVDKIPDPKIREQAKAERDALLENRKGLAAKANASQALIQPEIDKLIKNSVSNKGLDYFFKENLDGVKVPDEEKIDFYSKTIASSAGLPVDGYSKALIYNNFKSSLQYQKDKPLIEKKFNELYQKKYGTLPQKELEKDAIEGFTAKKEIEGNLQNQNKYLASEAKIGTKSELEKISSDFTPKIKELNESYKSNQAILNQEMQNNADQYKNGLISFEEAKQNENDLKAEFQKSEEEYKVNFQAFSDEYLNVQKEVIGRYDKKYKRQLQEAVQISEQRLREESAKYGKAYKVSPEIEKRYNETWKEASGSYYKAEESIKKLKDDIKGGGVVFAESLVSGLGDGLKTISSFAGIDEGVVMGDYLNSLFTLSSAKINSAKDLLDMTMLARSSGQMIGGMTPMIATQALVATLTQGASIPTQLLLQGGIGFALETMQNAGGAYEDKFAETGNVAAAEKAAQMQIEGNSYLLPLYALDGLPFISEATLGIKNVLLRGLAKGGIETLTELPQEYFQGTFEDLARDNKGLSDISEKMTLERLEETALNIIPSTFTMGAIPTYTGGVSRYVKDVNTKAFAAKQDLHRMSTTSLQQYLYGITLQRGESFAKSYLSGLQQNGSLKNVDLEQVANVINTAQQVVRDAAKFNLSKGKSKVYSYFMLNQQIAQTDLENAETLSVQKAAEARLKMYEDAAVNFLTNGKGDFAVITLANNEQYIASFQEIKNMLEDPKFSAKIAKREIEITLEKDKQASEFTALTEQINQIKENTAKAEEVSPSLGVEIVTPDGFKNRVFEENIQLGEAPSDAHISEEGYNYRVLSQAEVDAIFESGGVFAREGKQKGGNKNTKYWTKGNSKNWYGDKNNQETIRVKQDNFKEDEVVRAENVEVYNKETKQFEPLIKPKEQLVTQEGGKTENEIKVEELRAQEQAEKDATDPNDQEKLDEIYNRYDKLITPLLEGAKENETQVEGKKTPVKEEKDDEFLEVPEDELAALEQEIEEQKVEGNVEENIDQKAYLGAEEGMIKMHDTEKNTVVFETNNQIIDLGQLDLVSGRPIVSFGLSKFPQEGIRTEPKTQKQAQAVRVDGKEYEIIGRARDKKGLAVVKLKEKGTGLIRRLKGEKAERVLKDLSLQVDSRPAAVKLKTEGKEKPAGKTEKQLKAEEKARKSDERKKAREAFQEKTLEELKQEEAKSEKLIEQFEKQALEEAVKNVKNTVLVQVGEKIFQVTKKADGVFSVSQMREDGKMVGIKDEKSRKEAVDAFGQERSRKENEELTKAQKLIEDFKNEEKDRFETLLDKAINSLSSKGRAFDATIGLPIFVAKSALQIIRVGYKAGKSLKEAIADGYKYIKDMGYVSVSEFDFKQYVLTELTNKPKEIEAKEQKSEVKEQVVDAEKTDKKTSKEQKEENKKREFPQNVLDIAKETGLSPRQVENTYNKYDGAKNIEDITLEDYNKARAEGNKVKLENSKKAFEALLKEEAAKDKVSPTAQKELSKIKEGLDDKALKSASKIMENISEVREKLLKAGFIQSIDCKWG
jgi:hypothetical protein